MKMIPGYTFNVKKSKMGFKLGEDYKIYTIGKLKEENDEKFKYCFYSKSGPLEIIFDSTEQAEAIITKMSGK